MLKKDKSEALTKKFNEYFPGGHTNYRVSFETTQHRVFVEKTQGSHLWDIDGNDYIEFQGAMGPTYIGHRNPEWIAEMNEFIGRSSPLYGSGLVFSPDDIEVAERFVKYVPCCEQLKFNLSGSDAVIMAFRLARAYTGKSMILRFGGHYHGWGDNVLGGVVDPNPKGKPYPLEREDNQGDVSFTQGKWPFAYQESLMIPWNDFEVLEKTVEKYADEIAIIHFEPVICNHGNLMPRPGFLEKIRELCTKHNIVMSMDEIITGFRVGLSGAQGYFGIKPDLATFGKAIAGGVPMSAVAGKKEIMKLLSERKVLGPGTFNGYPLGMRSTLATLKILEKDNGAPYRHVAGVQKNLEEGLLAAAKKHGVPLKIQSIPGCFFTLFGMEDSDQVCYVDEDIKDFKVEKVTEFQAKMQEEGVMIMAGGRWYMNMAHSDEDIEKVIAAAERVMPTMK